MQKIQRQIRPQTTESAQQPTPRALGLAQRPHRASRLRTPTRALVALSALSLLTACGGGSGSEDTPTTTIEQASAALAQSLSAGTLDGVALRGGGDPNADLATDLAGMGGLRPKVTVQQVRRTGTTATLDLTYAWPLSSDWTYATRATMVNEDDTWKLVWQPTVLHPKLTDTTRLERSRTSTDRGTITGRGKTVIVQNTPVQMLGLNKEKTPAGELDASARAVAEAAGIDAQAYLDKVHGAGATDFVGASTVRTDELPANFLAIKGAETQTVTRPAAKTSGYAASVLGRVAEATQADVDASHGTVYPGDLIGVSGLQRSYEDLLRGRGGNKVYLAPKAVPVGQAKLGSDALVADFPDAPGGTLETTIDDDVQTRVDQALSGVKVPVSIAVLRVGNGAILATGDSGAARAKPDSTRAETAPGLAGAPISALALRRSGVRLSDQVTCERTANVAGVQVENPKGFEYNGSKMTLSQALARGCRTAAAQAAAKVNPEEVPRAAASLGLTRPQDLGVDINFGAAAAPADDAAKVGAVTGTNGVQAAPLALAAVAASVEASKPVVPFVVPDRTGNTDGVPPLAGDEAKDLADLMKQSSGSYGNLNRVAVGEVGDQKVLIGYSDALAVAIVIGSDPKSSTSMSSLARQVTSSSGSR